MDPQPLTESDEMVLGSIELRASLDPEFRAKLTKAAPMLLYAVLAARDSLDALREHNGLSLGCDNAINVALAEAPWLE